MKKAMELRSLCDLDVLIVLKDKEFNKVQVYNSSEDSSFPIDLVEKMVVQTSKTDKKPHKIQWFKDKDYNKFMN